MIKFLCMKTVTLYLCLLTLFAGGISCEPNKRDRLFASFNREAEDFFIQNDMMSSLQSLNESDRCLLGKVIQNDLDELDNGALLMYKDVFAIKRFKETFLDLDFYFIKDVHKSKYHFVSLPSLSEFIFNNEKYYVKDLKTNQWQLKGPEINFHLDASLWDELFKHEMFHYEKGSLDGFLRAQKQANDFMILLDPTLPMRACQVTEIISELDKNVSMNVITDIQRNEAVGLLYPVTGYVACYKFEGIGYICHRYMQAKSEDKLNFDVFLIPQRTRHYITRIDAVRYPECYGNSVN
jgi:hypothetical protein